MLASCGPPAIIRWIPVMCNAGDRVFPSFLPPEVERIRYPAARNMARRIERLPVKTGFAEDYIMSSCVMPLQKTEDKPTVLLHGFDRYTLPLLEEAGLEPWAIDILGWGFSDLEQRPLCDVASKRNHFYEFWQTYIKRPMVLVGPSLGAAIAIDFAVKHPHAVCKLILIDASVYAKGTDRLSSLPKSLAYAGVSMLKSVPLRVAATLGMFNKSSLSSIIERTVVARLHCLLPWWEDATVGFMLSGGYDVTSQISQVMHKTLIIWGGDDRIIDCKFASRLNQEIHNSSLHIIPDCGHIPHLEMPETTAQLIRDFVREEDQVHWAKEQN